MNEIESAISRMLNKDLKKTVEIVELTYRCPVHGEYTVKKFIYNDGTSIEIPNGCPTCEEERVNAYKERVEKQVREKTYEEYKASNISPEFFDKTLADFVPETKAQKAALQAIETIVSSRKGKLVILGTNGVGKTMLGSIAVKLLGGKIYTMYEISVRIRQSYSANSKETELDILNELVNEPLLVIDEVGRVKMSEAIQDWFSYILDKRGSQNKPYILLGNLHLKNDCEQGGCPGCFENYFDKDVLSRLTQNSVIIIIDAKDYRRNEHSCTFISDKRKEA
jgi:DNA replication protein DnaC